jgi:hypothetical protein
MFEGIATVEIDLLNRDISRWEITWKPSFLTALKVVAAMLAFPATFFACFILLWKLAALVGDSTVVAVSCVLVSMLTVTFILLLHHRRLADEGVAYQGPVLGTLSIVVLYLILPLVTYIVAALQLIDGKSHTLPEWSYFYGNMLVGGQLVNVTGFSTSVTPDLLYRKAINGIVLLLLNATVVGSVITILKQCLLHSVLYKERFGTQIDLWIHLLSPGYWFEGCNIKETGRLVEIDASDEKPVTIARSSDRRSFLKAGDTEYLFTTLCRYFLLPWVALLKRLSDRSKLHTLEVRKSDGIWRIHSPQFPTLHNIPFLEGMPDMIEFATRHIASAEQGFFLRFAEKDFLGAYIILNRATHDDGDWISYSWKAWGVADKGAIEGKMLRRLLPFDTPPTKIYVQASKIASSRR